MGRELNDLDEAAAAAAVMTTKITRCKQRCTAYNCNVGKLLVARQCVRPYDDDDENGGNHFSFHCRMACMLRVCDTCRDREIHTGD